MTSVSIFIGPIVNDVGPIVRDVGPIVRDVGPIVRDVGPRVRDVGSILTGNISWLIPIIVFVYSRYWRINFCS